MTTPFSLRKNGVRFFIDADATCPMPDRSPDWYTRWWKGSYPTWEPQTFRILDALLDPRRAYVDVGAWIGPTVLYAAAKAGRVICFEPDPVAHGVLLRNVAVNPQFRNITVVPAALGDSTGATRFGGNGELGNSESTILVREESYAAPRGTVSHKATDDAERTWREGQTTTVEMVTLEDVDRAHDLADCALLKMDIEGGEKIVVPAIRRFLAERRPALYLSLHWAHLSREEIESVIDILTPIYPFIYDEMLFRKVDRATIVAERLTSIVCLPRELAFSLRLRTGPRAAGAALKRTLRRAAGRAVRRLRG